MYLTQALHKSLLECPHATAVVFGARRHSFAQLTDRVARLAGALRGLGLQPGERVGMMSLNSDRFLEFLYGVWWAGGVVNPVNIRWSPKEVAYSLDDCDTRILLVDDTFAAQGTELLKLSTSLRTLIHTGDGAPPEGMASYEGLLAHAAPVPDAMRSGADLAAIMYTGGTTGLPKGVMLTHANMYTNSLNALAAIPRARDSVCIQTAPMFHVGGTGLTLQVMMSLRQQVILPSFDETAVLDAIEKERGTETFIVPTMLKRIIEHPRLAQYDLSSLAMLLYGAAPIDGGLLASALKALPQAGFWQIYGMTELSPAATVLPDWCHKPDAGRPNKLRSAGRPMPAVEMRIVDPQGQPVPNGTVGEITVRGPTVMAGYWNKPEQTAQALRDGWMHTGDGGYMDDDGFLFVVDRIKDMIVTGGENVYSAEVENAISSMAQVSACAVIGVPDDQWGERVHAVVVLRPGQTLSLDQITAHCRQSIAGYKCPGSVEFRDALPLSAAGKVLKAQMRAPYWKHQAR